MQQNPGEQPASTRRLPFGVDLQTTRAEYRQALWGFRAVPSPTLPQELRAIGSDQETKRTPA